MPTPENGTPKAEVTNPSVVGTPAQPPPKGWTIERLSALVSLLAVIIGGAYGVFTVWTQAQSAHMQAKTNAAEIRKLDEKVSSEIDQVQRSVGFVQLDVNTLCILATKDPAKCKTSSGK